MLMEWKYLRNPLHNLGDQEYRGCVSDKCCEPIAVQGNDWSSVAGNPTERDKYLKKEYE